MLCPQLRRRLPGASTSLSPGSLSLPGLSLSPGSLSPLRDFQVPLSARLAAFICTFSSSFHLLTHVYPHLTYGALQRTTRASAPAPATTAASAGDGPDTYYPVGRGRVRGALGKQMHQRASTTAATATALRTLRRGGGSGSGKSPVGPGPGLEPPAPCPVRAAVASAKEDPAGLSRLARVFSVGQVPSPVCAWPMGVLATPVLTPLLGACASGRTWISWAATATATATATAVVTGLLWAVRLRRLL